MAIMLCNVDQLNGAFGNAGRAGLGALSVEEATGVQTAVSAAEVLRLGLLLAISVVWLEEVIHGHSEWEMVIPYLQIALMLLAVANLVICYTAVPAEPSFCPRR